MGKYDDMIYMDRPVASKPRMATADRAKIFQPFAALKGHNELIKEQHRLTVEKKALTEQRRDELDSMLWASGTASENRGVSGNSGGSFYKGY